VQGFAPVVIGSGYIAGGKGTSHEGMRVRLCRTTRSASSPCIDGPTVGARRILAPQVGSDAGKHTVTSRLTRLSSPESGRRGKGNVRCLPTAPTSSTVVCHRRGAAKDALPIGYVGVVISLSARAHGCQPTAIRYGEGRFEGGTGPRRSGAPRSRPGKIRAQSVG